MGIIEGKNYKTLKMQLKDAAGVINPVLYLNQKNEEGKRINIPCAKGYKAEFVCINKWSYVNKEQEVVPGYEIILRDDKDGEVRLQTARTNASRSILNSLAGRQGEIKNLTISVRAKEKNGKIFAQAGLLINDEKSSWLLSIDEQNLLIKDILDPDTGKVVKKKYNKLEELLESHYNEINKRSQHQDIVSQVEAISTPTPITTEVDNSDDLPF